VNDSRRRKPAFTAVIAAAFGAMLGLAWLPATAAGPVAESPYLADFDTLTSYLAAEYAYFEDKQTDWQKVIALYRPRATTVSNRSEFVALLESVLDELYDNHTGLNTNLPGSARLVPSGADIWAEWQDDHAVITELRRGFSAEKAGLRVGMQIEAVNGEPIATVVAAHLPKSLRRPTPAARSWALRAVLAGTHDRLRTVTALATDGRKREYPLDQPGHRKVDDKHLVPLVQSRWLNHDTGYLAINDLRDDSTVARFDAALETFRHSRALVLDLRNIPGGGSSEIAEPILGRFIRHELAYQQVVPQHAAAYLKRVSARGRWTYDAPVVVLVGHWTASMAEGMAIGFDGMRRGTVVGTRMAALNGGVFQLPLPNSGIGVNFVGERLNHIDGSPRETFVPRVLVDLSESRWRYVADPVLRAGLDYLNAH
jgi:carboxyl-terminal processing protease